MPCGKKLVCFVVFCFQFSSLIDGFNHAFQMEILKDFLLFFKALYEIYKVIKFFIIYKIVYNVNYIIHNSKEALDHEYKGRCKKCGNNCPC